MDFLGEVKMDGEYSFTSAPVPSAGNRYRVSVESCRVSRGFDVILPKRAELKMRTQTLQTRGHKSWLSPVRYKEMNVKTINAEQLNIQKLYKIYKSTKHAKNSLHLTVGYRRVGNDKLVAFHFKCSKEKVIQVIWRYKLFFMYISVMK